MEDNRFFAINLRRLRENRRLSMERLAELAGVSEHTIFRAESKNVTPRGGNIMKIANALGVEQSTLFQDPNAESVSSSHTEALTAVLTRLPALDERQLDAVLGFIERINLPSIRDTIRDSKK